ncbi:MAG: NUDIX domain-containing protein [Chloroflexota bacterium]|nr:NUDIX domain-containing protein [Chloroflexota bacterium]
MSDNQINYLEWLLENAQIRVGARAIIINSESDHFLVEKNLETRDQYLNFIGGGIELGETLEACIEREMQEETNAQVARMEYLFVVENFIEFRGETLHGLGHYYEVEIDRNEVQSYLDGIELVWLSIDELAQADLRPHIVRDFIADGSYRSVRHLISRDNVA